MNRNNYAPHGSSHGQYVHPQHRQDERNNNHALQASHPAPYSNGHGGRQEQHYDERGYGAPVQQRGDWNGVRGGSYQQEWAPSPSHGSSGYGEGGYEGGLREGSSSRDDGYGPPARGYGQGGQDNGGYYQQQYSANGSYQGGPQGHHHPGPVYGHGNVPRNDWYAPQPWQQQSRGYASASSPQQRNQYPPQHYQQQQPISGGRGEGPFSKQPLSQNPSATPPPRTGPAHFIARDSPRRFERANTPPRSPQSRAGSPRIARAVGPPPPTAEYLATSLLPVVSLVPSLADPSLLILDLNGTLLCRLRKTGRGSRNPVLRDYLATFLKYVCGPVRIVDDDKDDTVRKTAATKKGKGRVGHRWDVVVYSSARATNVLLMLSAMSLVSHARADAHPPFGSWTAAPGDPLSLVWSREKLGLSTKEFTQNVETVKDLSMIWGAEEGEGRWTSERSVLLDDDAPKAAMQPYSHLPIATFEVDPNHKTPPTSPQPRSSSSRAVTPGHPIDSGLLSTIYLLSILRQQANIPAFIRADGLKQYLDLGDEELQQRGIDECKKAGVAVRAEWDAGWWETCEQQRRDIERMG